MVVSESFWDTIDFNWCDVDIEIMKIVFAEFIHLSSNPYIPIHRVVS